MLPKVYYFIEYYSAQSDVFIAIFHPQELLLGIEIYRLMHTSSRHSVSRPHRVTSGPLHHRGSNAVYVMSINSFLDYGRSLIINFDYSPHFVPYIFFYALHCAFDFTLIK